MNHHATSNWGNKRKNPESGIQTAPPVANRNQVRALLSGTPAEALGFIKRHAANRSFLLLAAELEEARTPVRRAVLEMVRTLLAESPPLEK